MAYGGFKMNDPDWTLLNRDESRIAQGYETAAQDLFKTTKAAPLPEKVALINAMLLLFVDGFVESRLARRRAVAKT